MAYTVYQFGVAPVSFLERSPFSFNDGMKGIPPDYVQADPVVFINGVPTIRGIPLGTPSSMQGAPVGTSDNPAPSIVPTYNRGSYGDSVILPVIFSGAGLPVDAQGNPLTIVLPRPNNTRILLLINNQTVPGPIFYNFDQVADNVLSVQIPQGGSRNWSDTIPQGNLSLFSNGAGNAIIEYMNANVTI